MNMTAQMEAMKAQPLGVPLVSTNMSAPDIEDSLRFRTNTSKTRNINLHALLQINIIILRVNIAKVLGLKNIQHFKPQKQHV